MNNYNFCSMCIIEYDQKKGKKSGSNSKGDDASADPNSEDFVVEPLTQKTIQTGMIILG